MKIGNNQLVLASHSCGRAYFLLAVACLVAYAVPVLCFLYSDKMMFRKGQKVVCINHRSSAYCKFPLQKGAIYTIVGFYQCSCGSRQLTLLEIPGITKMRCSCHFTSDRRQSYYVWRFKPLIYYDLYKELLSEINYPSKEEMLQYLEPA